MDSTLITAPLSTKKGSTWYFGYKAHIGVDKDTGLVRHIKVTSANVNDVMATSQLLTGEGKVSTETAVI